MTETDLSCKTAGILRCAGDPSPAIDDFKNYAGDVWFCFRHNFFKNYPQYLKMVQNDAPHDSLQSALKIKLETKKLMKIWYSKVQLPLSSRTPPYERPLYRCTHTAVYTHVPLNSEVYSQVRPYIQLYCSVPRYCSIHWAIFMSEHTVFMTFAEGLQYPCSLKVYIIRMMITKSIWTF